MTDAPERIWVEYGESGPEAMVWSGGGRVALRKLPEYVRADIHAAALERIAALEGAEGERAARICEALLRKGVSPEKWPDYFRVRSAGDELLARAALTSGGVK